MSAYEGAPKPAYYPETDHMGESMIQRLIAELLRPLLARFLAERGERAFVGADQFLYWVEDDPTYRLVPDVYVIPGEDPDAAPRSWQLWTLPRKPSFALEVVGRDIHKDYEDVPCEYKELGVDELVVFDPDAGEGVRNRVRWQVWRRVKKRGFVSVFRGNGDRVRSESLGCWLRCVGEGPHTRVRVAIGDHGDELVETDAERAEREREEKERERGEKEREREEKERERAARIALERELAELRAKLRE